MCNSSFFSPRGEERVTEPHPSTVAGVMLQWGAIPAWQAAVGQTPCGQGLHWERRCGRDQCSWGDKAGAAPRSCCSV